MRITISSWLRVLAYAVSLRTAGSSDAGLVRREQFVARHDSHNYGAGASEHFNVRSYLTPEAHIRIQSAPLADRHEPEATQDLNSLYHKLEGALAQGTHSVSEHDEASLRDFLERTKLYSDWAKSANPNIMCQSGFAAGQSALRLLAQTEATLYAFDPGEQGHSKIAAEFLRSRFPGRLNNIWGDSARSLPAFTSQHPDVQCDLMVLDGGHDYSTAMADLKNFAKLASSQHLLALGSASCSEARCKGPRQAWRELLRQGCIREADGSRDSGRGFIVGEYVPCRLWPQIGSQGYLLMELEASTEQVASSWRSDRRHPLDHTLLARLGSFGGENLTTLTAELEAVIANAKESIDEGHSEAVGELTKQTAQSLSELAAAESDQLAQQDLRSSHRTHLDQYLLGIFTGPATKQQLKNMFGELEHAIRNTKEPIEGHTDDSGVLATQTHQYDKWASNAELRTICETGFNAGHSALRFLAQSNAHLFEFDLGNHDYAKAAAQFLGGRFPGRLNVTWGDSTKTLPQMHAQHPDLRCDLVIVDGGHDDNAAEMDLRNFAKMASKKHVLAIDDTPCTAGWCAGPTHAWRRLVAQGCITQVSRTPMGPDRGFSTGRYAPCPLWPHFGEDAPKAAASLLAVSGKASFGEQPQAALGHNARGHLDQFLLANQGRKVSKEQLQPLFDQLEQTIADAGQTVTEGHADSIGQHVKQTNQYDAWANDTNFKTICETGLNAGHSALRFLAQTDARVYEFDSGEHDYARTAATFLSRLFPQRLVTVWGDSRQSVPNFFHGHQQVRCDLIIVDGGRDRDTAYEDLGNFAFMAHGKTVLAIDDTPCDASYCAGPTQAWKELVEDGCINELDSVAMGPDRGFSIGHYQPCPLWPDKF